MKLRKSRADVPPIIWYVRKKSQQKATTLALVFIIVVAAAGAGIYWYEATRTCQSTSCQPIAIESPQQQASGGSGATSASTGSSASLTTGTAYFDVWANFSDGASPLHFTKQAPLTASQQFLQVNGHSISAITVKLRLVFNPPLSQASYSGSILVYTCGACGNQQVYLGTVSIIGASSKGILTSSSFPALQAASNLTILAWPDGVSVSTGGVKYVLGMSPVVISSISVNQQATKTVAPTSCPSTLPLYSTANPGQNWTPQQVGTATLLSATAAAQALGIQGSYSGLLATYSLGGLNIFNVVAPGLGGSSYHPGYGLLTGYHYLNDGSCESY